MRRLVTVCAIFGFAAACRGGEEGRDVPAASPAPTAASSPVPDDRALPSPDISPTPDPPPGGARSVSEETDNFVFRYSWPAEAGDIPELATLLDRRLERARATIERQAAEGRATARDSGFPFNKYSSGMEWKVVADVPGWLSLSGHMDSYTGGAHGIYDVESLMWDKHGGQALKAIDLFSSPEALGEAVHGRFCERLDRKRAEKRPEPIEDDIAGFNECPAIDELTVLAGSSSGRSLDRLTLYAGPYVAGPYAEGAYEVDLDIDQAVLAEVKPQYRDSFRARR